MQNFPQAEAVPEILCEKIQQLDNYCSQKSLLPYLLHSEKFAVTK